MDSRIVIVDPFESDELLELAELSGMPFTRVRAWHFEPSPADRVITTIPLPRGAAADGLGVVVDVAVPAGIGERWPERVVTLRHGREDVLAYLSGSDAPGGRVVGVVGLAGGLGATTLAACLARTLAGHPIAVALLDTDPVPSLESRLGFTEGGGVRWADLAGEDGPLLPQRIDAALPVWHRVRIATCDGRGVDGAPFLAVAHALSRTHDVTVVDLPRAPGPDGAALLRRCDDVVVLLGGRRAELAAWERLRAVVGPATLHPVVRGGGELAAGDVARELGCAVIALGLERAVAAGAAHGAQPGDRARGAVMKAARVLAGRMLADRVAEAS